MGFDPQKFFIGVVDFFAVLMPGALLAYLGRDLASPVLLHKNAFEFEGAESWMVFFFASYLLGHFAFLIGALLDEILYDRFRKCTYLGQIERLAKDDPLSSRTLRRIAAHHCFFGKRADAAVTQVLRIKARALQGISPADAINAYQWCKVRLSKEHPEGLIAVQRFEADSKFFRSLVVVLAVVMMILIPLMLKSIYDKQVSLALQQLALAVVLLLGSLLALWRYIDVRFKSTQQAYWFAIALDVIRPVPPKTPVPAKAVGAPTHAGGVVYRRDDAILYLLVQGERKRTEWVLPKGHIEIDERPKETAVREVQEETGQWARVKEWLSDVSFAGGEDGPALVRFYRMESQEDDGKAPPPENRQYRWLPLADAQREATYAETRDLLGAADRQIKAEKLKPTSSSPWPLRWLPRCARRSSAFPDA